MPRQLRLRSISPLMRQLIPLAGFTAIVVALLLAWSAYEDAAKRGRQELLAAGERLASNVDHELTIRLNTLNSMQVLAEQYLAERSPLDWSVHPFLVPEPQHHGYSLRLPAGFSNQSLGNITGLGPIPAEDSPAVREMQMALALTPMFRALIGRDPDTPWVYYTSARQFMYLYPRVGVADYFVTPQTFGMDFYMRAHPAKNPAGELVWTPAYQDDAGRGWMVSMSAPVHNRGVFCGVISVDITTSRLAWLLERIPIANASRHLLQADGKKLASAGGPAPQLQPANWPQHTLQPRGQRLLAVFPLEANDWYLVLDGDAKALQWEAIRQSLPFWLLVLFLSGSLGLLLVLLRSWARVEHLSSHDWLTGLWNRRAFDEQLQDALGHLKRGGSSLALILFDVDDFKHYNDTLGHPAGDKALQDIARVVQQVAQRQDDRVYRLGGEEFAIVTSLPDQTRLQAFMDRVAAAVYEYNIQHPGSSYGVLTISLGGVLMLQGAQPDAAEVYRQADQALYRAKARGKNCSHRHDGSD
ncbi:sensor domain-containing diguanylate cyclase [Vogesella oryzae]|uniref:sensor domain-containing diguanylate cyclase n=1 Tax=Vogesella oryzae TaxID=1735285 RepID=UPI001583CEB0|nr:sensor domain-containing diguanylate cyclase [Vogesella oryzae]